MLFTAFLLLVHGEKAFAPAATPGRMMPRANSPIAPQQAAIGQRPMPQAVPPMQPVSQERSSMVMMASNVLFYSGLATLAAGAGMALRRSGAATTETELTEVLDAEHGVARTVAPVMYDISEWGNVWGLDAQKAVFDAWDPEKPRNYDNFNPFERNDEGQQCDSNGCFPGQSKGYKPPDRPDVSWAIMKENEKIMEEIKKDPKFDVKGKPGNFIRSWQDGLGAPP